MLAHQLIDEASAAQIESAEHATALLGKWASQFPAEELRAAIAALEDKRKEIDQQIAAYRTALLAGEDLLAFGTNGTNGKPRKREAVLALLAEDPDREFKLAEIRAQLIDRELLPDTERAAGALQMTLQNMYRRYGEVERTRPGYYRIARVAGKEAGADAGVHTLRSNRAGSPEEGIAYGPSSGTPTSERVATR